MVRAGDTRTNRSAIAASVAMAPNATHCYSHNLACGWRLLPNGVVCDYWMFDITYNTHYIILLH